MISNRLVGALVPAMTWPRPVLGTHSLKWGTHFNPLVERTVCPWTLAVFRGIPRFPDTSSVQYPRSARYAGWISGFWNVIILNIKYGVVYHPITTKGVLNTARRPSYVQYITISTIVDLHPLVPPARQLRKWTSRPARTLCSRCASPGSQYQRWCATCQSGVTASASNKGTRLMTCIWWHVYDDFKDWTTWL